MLLQIPLMNRLSQVQLDRRKMGMLLKKSIRVSACPETPAGQEWTLAGLQQSRLSPQVPVESLSPYFNISATVCFSSSL